MSQTLTQTTLATSPIAYNSASQKAFDDGYLKLATLSQAERNTIAILGMIYAIAALPFTDYTLNHKQLIQDAQVYTHGLSLVGVGADPGLAYACWNRGRGQTANISSSIPTLLQEGRDFLALPEELQQRCLLTLLVGLGN